MRWKPKELNKVEGRDHMKVGKQMTDIVRKPRDVGELTKVSMFLTTVVLCVALIIMSVGIRNHYVKELEVNARNLALGYSHSLRKTVEASEIVQGLVQEKLLYATGIIATMEEDVTSEDLTQIANTIDVEEIDIYDEWGRIIYSNIPGYIGWKAPMGHPVQNFIASGKTFHVDPLRENTLSGHLVLYGYERLGDGRTVQVGISAQEVEKLIAGFELNLMLEAMLEHSEVGYVLYIDEERVVLGSNTGEGIGEMLPVKEEKDLFEALGIGELQLIPQESYYEVEEPVYLDEVLMGHLVLGIHLEETRDAIKDLNGVLTVVLVMIYLVGILMMYMLHYKNTKLFSLAYEDDLTGLPNQKYLQRELRWLLKEQKRPKLALILVHVPRFSKITMSKGYEQGENILREIAGHLKAMEKESVTFFRHSDEKFILMVKDYGEKKELVYIMEELSAIAPVLEGSWSEKRYSALRFGALEVSEKYTEESEVLKDVLIAVNHVKESSVVPYIFFDQVMEEKLRKETLIEGALKEALEHTDHEVLSLHYQPLIHGKTEEVVGLEALARMHSPQYGPIPPLVFIEIAEKNGLMMQLGEVLLRKAAAFGKRLELLGTPLRISVNISGMQLIQDDFMEVVKRVLKETGIPPKFLEFEITESVFLGNYEVVNSKLMELKALGIVLSIDDFGTGYSSFARLKELHVDGVKIDRYFVSRISTLPEDQLISSDIIRMVHKYGLFVVAEGVENVVEKEYLQKEHCDVLQGYYFSKPLKEQDIVLFLNNNKPSREGFDEEEV